MSGSGHLRILGTAGLMVAAGLLAVGCAPTATPSISGSDPGAVLVQRRCSVCHTLERVVSAKKDEAGWNATVDKMRVKGAVVSEAEQKQIVAYLSGR